MSRRSQHLRRRLEREWGVEKKKLQKQNAALVQPEELIADDTGTESTTDV